MKFLHNMFFSFVSMAICQCGFAKLPEPYGSVQVLKEEPFGYYDNGCQINDIFEKNDIRVVVEIGSWIGGGSTRHMGDLLKNRQGTLYAVDTWLGNLEQQPGREFYQPILTYVYQQFLSNMIHWNLTDVVVPYRMKSVEAAKTLQVRPDLIYIDGEHTIEAVYEDLVSWHPFVKDSGVLCGDDWTWETVRIAVARFAAEKNLAIEASGNFWRLHKR